MPSYDPINGVYRADRIAFVRHSYQVSNDASNFQWSAGTTDDEITFTTNGNEKTLSLVTSIMPLYPSGTTPGTGTNLRCEFYLNGNLIARYAMQGTSDSQLSVPIVDIVPVDYDLLPGNNTLTIRRIASAVGAQPYTTGIRATLLTVEI